MDLVVAAQELAAQDAVAGGGRKQTVVVQQVGRVIAINQAAQSTGEGRRRKKNHVTINN